MSTTAASSQSTVALGPYDAREFADSIAEQAKSLVGVAELRAFLRDNPIPRAARKLEKWRTNLKFAISAAIPKSVYVDEEYIAGPEGGVLAAVFDAPALALLSAWQAKLGRMADSLLAAKDAALFGGHAVGPDDVERITAVLNEHRFEDTLREALNASSTVFLSALAAAVSPAPAQPETAAASAVRFRAESVSDGSARTWIKGMLGRGDCIYVHADNFREVGLGDVILEMRGSGAVLTREEIQADGDRVEVVRIAPHNWDGTPEAGRVPAVCAGDPVTYTAPDGTRHEALVVEGNRLVTSAVVAQPFGAGTVGEYHKMTFDPAVTLLVSVVPGQPAIDVRASFDEGGSPGTWRDFTGQGDEEIGERRICILVGQLGGGFGSIDLAVRANLTEAESLVHAYNALRAAMSGERVRPVALQA